MPIDPCGTIMDVARFATIRGARFFSDSIIETKIKWYRAPDGAKFFPTVHKWGHLDWYSEPWKAQGVGEVFESPQKWFNGFTPAGVTGQHFHGTLEQFQDGCKFDPSSWTPRNTYGVALACTGTPPPPPPIVVDLCGQGIVHLPQTLQWKFQTSIEFPNICELGGDILIPIVWDAFNLEWFGTFSQPATTEWALTSAEVRFSPWEDDGTIEFGNWVVSKIGEPDCFHLVNVRTISDMCPNGLITLDPFKAQSFEGAYFDLCTGLACLYRIEVTIPG